MDFDIGTFIYILLTLVFIIIGSLGKKKKTPQKTATPMQNPDTNKSDPLTENFKRLFGNIEDPFNQKTNIESEEEDEYEEKETRSDTIYDKIDTPESTLDVPYSEKGRSEPYKLEDHIQEIMEQTRSHMTGRSEKRSNYVTRALRNFDPKKALLYSEIFKPKYF